MNPDQIKIRKAIVDDSVSLVNLLRQLGYENTQEEIIERIKELTNSNSDSILVAVLNDAVVGLISFHAWPRFYEWGKIGRISSLIVEPTFRRKGIGQKLIKEIETFAKQANCARIEVTSRSQRKDAHAFYEACGYDLVKSKRFMKACLDTNIA
jgi:N-acetylglutamate synthase-like GNAT family acetyltransferase